MTLNPLAAPKGVRLVCERCQKPAYIQCAKCRVTYYCSEAHEKEGWEAIHEKICPIVAVLLSPQPHASTSEERERRKQQQLLRKHHIIDLALREGRRYLHEGQPNLAVPAALQALKFLTEVHGSAHIELTPSYLVLAEAAIGMGKLSEADQYLSQAQWSVLRSRDCEPWLKAQLHRNLGLLAAVKGKTEEARRQFAEDIYQSSVAYGPHATETSGGYYHLGRVFLYEDKPKVAASLHDQVVAMWREQLQEVVETKQKEAEAAQRRKEMSARLPQSAQPTASLGISLDATQLAEAHQMLYSIREHREQQTRSSPPDLVPIYHSLALLHHVLNEDDKCVAYAQRSLEILQDGQSDVDTKQRIETLLKLAVPSID